MLRLWNMLEGRCSFKKKLGLHEVKEDDEENELANKVQYKVKQVKWEKTKGEEYVVLFDKKLEIMSAN